MKPGSIQVGGSREANSFVLLQKLPAPLHLIPLICISVNIARLVKQHLKAGFKVSEGRGTQWD